MLAEKRDILATLSDLESLSALPEGSLGATYAAFMSREQRIGGTRGHFGFR